MLTIRYEPMASGYAPYVPNWRLRPIIEEFLSKPGNTLEELGALTGLPTRRFYDIRKKEGAVRFETADKILTGLGHVEIWLTDLKDLYQEA